MSCRTCFSILKGIRPKDASMAIDVGVASGPGDPAAGSGWSDWSYRVQPKRYYAVACDDALVLADGAWRLASTIASQFDVPHLELRVQEGDHWDFTLQRGGKIVADFSTRVGYYSRSRRRPWKSGDLNSFATGWGIPPASVQPYFIDWDSITTPRLAVATDSYPAGTWEQVLDFMRVLGVASPFEHPDSFEFEATQWVPTYRRQPLWRRVVRQASVWINGVYPDVPKPTPAEQQRLDALRRQIRVERVTLDELEE